MDNNNGLFGIAAKSWINAMKSMEVWSGAKAKAAEAENQHEKEYY